MTHVGGIETDCECQYTLTLTNQVVPAEFSEMKDNFNHVPSIHEVDEEETDEECTYRESAKQEDANQDTEVPKDIPDDESAYTGSFCSDDSCDESEATNATSNDAKISEEDSQATTEEGSLDSYSFDKSFLSEKRRFAPTQMRSRRRNMSFTDEEMRKIERENQLLLRKIMTHQRPRDKIHEHGSQAKTSSSAINRKKLQRKIDYDNMLLLQRIQQTKSCVMNAAAKPGCRVTFL